MQTDTDLAYIFCKKLTLRHYENFPVGSLLIPSDKRKYIYSIYAYARTADDIADSANYSKEEKLSLLKDYETELNKTVSGNFNELKTETRNIFIALSNTIAELNIPVKEFMDLLTAFRQDSVKQRYSDFEDLLEYSKFSADPVGHLVLYVFGYDPERDKRCYEYSDKICTALQLTNFWQDVSVDLKLDRIYIPGNVMKKFSYSYEMLTDKIENGEFREMMRYLTEKTMNLFEEGKNITELVSGRLKLELRATIAGGIEILKKIDKINYNLLSKRVTISNSDKLKLLGKIFWK